MAKLCSTLVVISCWLVVLAYSPRFAGAAVQSHYERPTTNNGPYQQRVIVFVHGIFGDADDTWRYSPNVYWPRLLLKDAVFADSDIYVASYSTPYLGNTMTVDEVVTNLNNRLDNDEVFSKHREVVFVCHSLGGLIVQRLLLTFRAYAQQVPFIYFFSTPETGAQIAKLGALFSSDPLLKAMFPGDENGYLQNLENEWRAARFPIRRFCAYEKKKYKGVLVVDRLSGTRNCDDPPIAINEDHSSIVKPNGIEHDSYIALRNAVKANPVSHSGKISRRRTPEQTIAPKPTPTIRPKVSLASSLNPLSQGVITFSIIDDSSIPIESLDVTVRTDIHIIRINQLSDVPNVSFLTSPKESIPMSIGINNGGKPSEIPVNPSFKNGSILPEARIYCPKLLAGQSLIISLGTIAMNPMVRGPSGKLEFPKTATAPPRDPKILKIKGTYETGQADNPNRYSIDYEAPLQRSAETKK